MTKTLRNHLIAIATFAASFLVVLLIATFFDLKINTALYKPTSFFGQVVSNIGEMPMYLALVAISIIFYQGATLGDKYFLLCKIIAGVFVIGTSYVLISNIFSNLAGADLLYQPAYIAFFAAAVSVLSILATNKIDKKIMRKLCTFALFLLIVCAVSQGITFLIKNVVQRMRFRNMANGEGFTPWYIINFGTEGREALIAAGSIKTGDAFKSFPSGHVTNSAILFALVFLPNIFPKLKRWKPAIFAVAAVWTVMVCIARIVVGAHFLSDVLVGASITITVTACTKWLFEYFFCKKGKSMEYSGCSAEGCEGCESIVVSVGDFTQSEQVADTAQVAGTASAEVVLKDAESLAVVEPKKADVEPNKEDTTPATKEPK